VPAVTGLDRAGQRAADRLAIGAGPVAAYDLDAGVPAQPRLQHVSLSAGQDIDPLAGLGADTPSPPKVRQSHLSDSPTGGLTQGSSEVFPAQLEPDGATMLVAAVAPSVGDQLD
jgi:hypothetical protein